jgi:hypothetical protein
MKPQPPRRTADHGLRAMRYSVTEHTIPAFPPDEVLADLDHAARSLDELSRRAAELTLEMDAQTGGLRIELADDGGTRPLSPSELFALLVPDRL